MQIIDRLSKTKNGISALIGHNIFEYLISEEMLFRSTTLVSVRHVCASIIIRSTMFAPQQFLFDKFQRICYNGLTRRIDGVIETTLLESVLSHLMWLLAEQKELQRECTMMSYLIEEIRKEAFEDVNHVSCH